MKQRLFTLLAASCLFVGVQAQDIFQMVDFSSEDLNGTARFVGMGGAMSALGADMSVMGTNPAGIGLYRKSDVAASLSFVSQSKGRKYEGKDKNHVSFDNMGIVYVSKLKGTACRFLNIGFNYHKIKDFNQIVNTSYDYGDTPGASQTWQMSDLSNYWGHPSAGTLLSDMGYQAYLLGDDYSAYNAGAYYYDKARWGSIQSYDFNISANFSDRVYAGITIGVQHVDYNSISCYTEDLYTNDGTYDGLYNLTNYRDISGYGVNFKFGLIFRPIESSPFRVGLSVATRTHYDLKYRATASLDSYLGSEADESYREQATVRYDYNIKTPWKFGISLGHTLTFGTSCLALDAEYEYSDYSTAEVTYGDDWDGWDDDEDLALNNEADRWLNGVSTFKFGVEFMPIPEFAIRAGYNHVTSPVDHDAYVNQFINSASLDYATSTAYAVPSPTNRYTVGLGFNTNGFYIDATCKFENRHARYYAFNTQAGSNTSENECPSTKINLNNTQILFTVGYRF